MTARKHPVCFDSFFIKSGKGAWSDNNPSQNLISNYGTEAKPVLKFYNDRLAGQPVTIKVNFSERNPDKAFGNTALAELTAEEVAVKVGRVKDMLSASGIESGYELQVLNARNVKPAEGEKGFAERLGIIKGVTANSHSVVVTIPAENAAGLKDNLLKLHGFIAQEIRGVNIEDLKEEVRTAVTVGNISADSQNKLAAILKAAGSTTKDMEFMSTAGFLAGLSYRPEEVIPSFVTEKLKQALDVFTDIINKQGAYIAQALLGNSASTAAAR